MPVYGRVGFGVATETARQNASMPAAAAANSMLMRDLQEVSVHSSGEEEGDERSPLGGRIGCILLSLSQSQRLGCALFENFSHLL